MSRLRKELIPTFLLLEDFTPPRDPLQAEALGLPPACRDRASAGVFLRFDGLPHGGARQLAAAVQRCGGWAETSQSGENSLCAGLPQFAREAFANELRQAASSSPLAGELVEALRAARGGERLWHLSGSIVLPVGARTLVLGILNVTPDSFHDGGRYDTPRRAVARALQMEAEGADLIDLGGESTRPGSLPVGVDEELRRVLPVIETLQGRLRIPISIDTTKAEVARRSLQAGAGVVNDVSGLRFDPDIAEAAAERRAGLIVSHLLGKPRTMMRRPRYRHLIPEVVGSLQQAVRFARSAGVSPDAILVDPGLGFGKTATHNLLLLHHLKALHSTGRPILVGASRKSFLSRILGDGDRLPGSLAVAALSSWQGAAAVRVHDVAESVAAIRVAEAIRRSALRS